MTPSHRAREASAIAALLALAAAFVASAAAGPEAPASAPRLVLAPVGSQPSSPIGFGVVGLPDAMMVAAAERPWVRDDWQAVFRVHVESEDRAPLYGDYRVTPEGLWLVPAFPPVPGVRYRAVFRPAALARLLAAATGEASGSAPMVADLRLDVLAPGEPTAVAAVYPSAGEVPENLLRWYLHFTAPMSRGDVYRWIRLEDGDGHPLEHSFLELSEEMWDQDSRRLTLLLDPGRIKTGLAPRREEGPILKAGRQVSLAVDAGWPDASGRHLSAPWQSRYRVTPADRQSPDPSRWRMVAPRSGGRAPLHVELDERLDQALLRRWVWIETGAGRVLEGSIDVEDGERSWTFAPVSPWQAGAHALRVDPRLEDLAGNRVGRKFEVDLTGPDADPSTSDSAPVSLPFIIAP